MVVIELNKLLKVPAPVNFNYEHLQVDGAKLVSVNSRDEHAFIVKWLKENAKQGYIFVCSLAIVVTVVPLVKLYSKLQFTKTAYVLCTLKLKGYVNSSGF